MRFHVIGTHYISVSIIGMAFHAALQGLSCVELRHEGKFAGIHSDMVEFSRRDGQRFLLKQRYGVLLHKHFMSVLEVLGSKMAESMNIRCNYVEIVPADQCKEYKHYPDRPATLHSFVPGVQIDKSIFKNQINIKQRNRNERSSKRGLNLAIMRNMAKHPFLPVLVAFDTFIGNRDRAGVNLLYEEKTDTFTAIDFGDTFKFNLSEIALKNLRKFKKAKKLNFNAREWEAVAVYRDTLVRLVSMYNPRNMYSMLLAIAREAKIISDNPTYASRKQDLEELLALHKKFMFENYASVKKLIAELDDILGY